MEHREKEMQLLQENAEKRLRQPIRLLPTLPRTDYLTILRLWHSPSFLSKKTWFIYQPTGVGRTRYKPAVVEICWDAPSDANRMMINPLAGLKSGFRPEPTLTMRFGPFDLGKYSALLNQRNATSVALSAKDDLVGCDGEVWGFENFDYFQSSRFQWWGEGPRDWQPLVKGFHDLLAAIREALEERDYQAFQPELRVEPIKEINAR
jgi:hypothetical protein